MSSPIQNLLPLLDGLQQAGTHRWTARCPAHKDRHPSLSIRELDDGRLLLHCFAGCAVGEILASVGLELTDLFPPKPLHHNAPSERLPFASLDALRALSTDAIVVCAAAKMLARGEPLPDTDIARLIDSSERIANGLSAVVGRAHRGSR